MTKAEEQMKKYLNLPLGFKASFAEMFEIANRFERFSGNNQDITPFGMVCWLDQYGDFTSKKDRYSIIVNKMFTRMGEDMVQLFDFIELCQNNYKEETND